MIKKFLSLIVALACLTVPLLGGVVLIDGNWSNEKYLPKYTVAEHYDRACLALSQEDHSNALNDFLTIVLHFYDSPFYADALFYSGVCFYHMRHYALADKHLSYYLELSGQTRHFDKVFEYKYLIAEKYRNGALRPLFGLNRFPKLAPSSTSALNLYDEVIVAMPAQEIAAKALYAKSKLLRKKREYEESIESLKALARRFPKHPLGAKAYLAISKIYLDKSYLEPQNPDYLSLAQVNLEKMKKSFPTAPQITALEENLLEMKEVYGKSLYDSGRFYERKKKFQAASIYYQNALSRYPGTEAAKLAELRLTDIKS